MIGDLFLIRRIPEGIQPPSTRFRPHDWGSFFNEGSKMEQTIQMRVFVPMIGDLFLIIRDDDVTKETMEFSSP